MLNSKQLAKNILHRFLEEGILDETNGKFEMLVEKTLLEEIDRFAIINISPNAKIPGRGDG